MCLAMFLLVLLVSVVPARVAGVCVCVRACACVQTTFRIYAVRASTSGVCCLCVCVHVCRLLALSVMDKFLKLNLMCALVCVCVCVCVYVCV